MSLPTSKETTDLYLYGTPSFPDLIDEQIIRENPLTAQVERAVDVTEYMTFGAGRFATGDQFELVSTFFSAAAIDGLQPGDSLTKADYAARIGVSNYGLNVYQRNLDDGAGDLAERVYVWNSLRYKISDSAIFKINLDGTRVIENFGIEPVTNDNFDFVSEDASIPNIILSSWIDPWKIGRQVSLNFTGSIVKQVYDTEDYADDLQVSQSWSQPSYTTLFENMAELANGLWDSGDIRFVDQDNRVIKYGTIDDDTLRAEFEQIWLTTIAENFTGSGAVGAGKLEAFQDFGFHIIAGDGADTIYGSLAGDYIQAGEGKDIIFTTAEDSSDDTADDFIFAGAHDDIVTVGGGSDIVSLGAGDDKITLKSPSSESGGPSVQTVIWGGDGVDSFYFEGTAHVLSISVDGMSDELLANLSTSALFSYVNAGLEWPYDYIIINLDEQDKIFLNGVQLTSATVTPRTNNDDTGFKFDYDYDHTWNGYDYYRSHSMIRIESMSHDDRYVMPGFDPEAGARLQVSDKGLVVGVTLYNGSGLIGSLGIDGFYDGAAGISFIGDGIFAHLETTTTVQNIDVTYSDTIEFEPWTQKAFYIPTEYTLVGDPEVTVELPFEGIHLRPDGYESYIAPSVNLNNFQYVVEAGTSGDDDFTGTSAPQKFQGGVGTDTVDYGLSTGSVSANLSDGGALGDAIGDRYFFIENLIGSAYSDFLGGSSDNNELAGNEGNDVLYGYAGDDALIGGQGDDYLVGGSGNDALVGGEGNDTLIGGEGNDIIDGGTGSDTLELLGNSISEYKLFRDAANSIIAISQIEGVDVISGVETFRIFSSGWQNLSLVDVLPVLPTATLIDGTSNGEILVGTSANDIIRAYDGNDTIDAGTGNDNVEAGAGDDVIAIGSGNNVVDGGAGYDVVRFASVFSTYSLTQVDVNTLLIESSEGITIVKNAETIEFNDHSIVVADYLPRDIVGTSGNDGLSGSNGDDHLEGGKGDDILQGSAGNDVYWYARGDGHDVIIETDIGGSGDQLVLSGLNPQAVTIVRSGIDLIISIAESAAGAGDAGSIHIIGGADLESERGLEGLVFASANPIVYWTKTQMVEYAIAAPVIDIPEPTVNGTSGDDTLEGTWGDDVFEGGHGNDMLLGSGGSDTYLYAVGDGNDYVDDEAGFTDNIDTLILTDLNATDISAERSNLNLVLTVLSTGHTITIDEQYYSNTEFWGIEKIQFANGAIWNKAALDAIGSPYGDPFNAIIGTNGNDTVDGTWGDDFIRGALGDDRLQGSGGNDIYVYASGDGNDYLDDESGRTDEFDILRFTDLNSSDISAARDGLHLVLTVLSTSQTIVIDEQYYSDTDYWGVEKVEFADGSFWDRDDLDTIGSPYGDPFTAIVGTTGNDTLNGTWGDDIVRGAAGDDLLLGDAGSDTYIYVSGDGNDYIDDESGFTDNTDVLLLTDLNAGDISLARNGVHLEITVIATGHTITIDEQFYSDVDYWGIEKIQFADGSFMDRDDILDAVTPSAGRISTPPDTGADLSPVETSDSSADTDLIVFDTGATDSITADSEPSYTAALETTANAGEQASAVHSAEIISLSDYLGNSSVSDQSDDLWYQPEPIGAVV